MYRWSANIDNIKANNNVKLKYQLFKDPMVPYDQTEILVYDKNGELIVIE